MFNQTAARRVGSVGLAVRFGWRSPAWSKTGARTLAMLISYGPNLTEICLRIDAGVDGSSQAPTCVAALTSNWWRNSAATSQLLAG